MLISVLLVVLFFFGWISFFQKIFLKHEEWLYLKKKGDSLFYRVKKIYVLHWYPVIKYKINKVVYRLMRNDCICRRKVTQWCWRENSVTSGWRWSRMAGKPTPTPCGSPPTTRCLCAMRWWALTRSSALTTINTCWTTTCITMNRFPRVCLIHPRVSSLP